MNLQLETDATEAKLFLKRFKAQQGFKVGLMEGAMHLSSKAQAYPAESHRPQPFVSDQQRRGFFAKLHAGEIEVPHQRGTSPGSQTLGKRWSVSSGPGGWSAIVANRATYAGLVQGAKQTLYHKVTGWKTLAQIWTENAQRVRDILVTRWIERSR